jgi:molecular chaperone GrpE
VSTERPDTAGEQPVVEPEAGAEAPAEAGAELTPEPADAGQVAAQRDEYLDALQRLKAEFDNYRRRSERDRQSAAATASREVVRDLLPVMDNLERAVAALGDQGEAIVAGVEMVRGQLAAVLAGQGVAEIPAATDGSFDPNFHEAIAQLPVSGRAPGSIVEVVEKGYTHADIVLRPSKVVVASEATG